MKAAIIARLTLAHGLRQPVFWLTTGLGSLLIGLSVLFGQFNFDDHDRVRLLLTTGVAVVVLSGLFLSVLTASAAVHDELSSRTSLTLFAKPLSRGDFLLGKAAGAWLTACTAGVLLALLHAAAMAAVTTWGFDTFSPGPEGHPAHFDPMPVPWAELVAAQVLALLHTGIFACLAASCALFLPLVPNLLVAFGVFVIGHVLAGLGLQGGLLVPALALFNVDEALQFADVQLAFGYLPLCLLYAGLYSAACLLIGLGLFSKLDIP